MSTASISIPAPRRTRVAGHPGSPRATRPSHPSSTTGPVSDDAFDVTCERPLSALDRSESWGTVRLTRRGRVVVLLVAMAAAFGLFTSLSGPAASTRTDHHMVTHTVVVSPGQTLWDIARATAPGSDPRAMVAQIVEMNGLSSAGDIRAGAPLLVPGK